MLLFITVIVSSANLCKSNPTLFKLIKDIHYKKKFMKIETKTRMYLIMQIVKLNQHINQMLIHISLIFLVVNFYLTVKNVK